MKKQRQNLKNQVEKIMKSFLPDINLEGKKKSKEKPFWSLTQAEFEELTKQEEEEVVDFMDNLDCQEILDDIEVP